MPEPYLCGAMNPVAEPIWAVRCSLGLRHQGPHRAHYFHDTAQRYVEWSQTDAEVRALKSTEREPS